MRGATRDGGVQRHALEVLRGHAGWWSLEQWAEAAGLPVLTLRACLRGADVRRRGPRGALRFAHPEHVATWAAAARASTVATARGEWVRALAVLVAAGPQGMTRTAWAEAAGLNVRTLDGYLARYESGEVERRGTAWVRIYVAAAAAGRR